jgi:hypothetical protein
MPQLTKEDNENAISIGNSIDRFRRDTPENEALTSQQFIELGQELENFGVADILRHHYLFTDEEVDLVIVLIFEKSDAAGEEWKSISQFLYNDYMCAFRTPSAECIRELDLS